VAGRGVAVAGRGRGWRWPGGARGGWPGELGRSEAVNSASVSLHALLVPVLASVLSAFLDRGGLRVLGHAESSVIMARMGGQLLAAIRRLPTRSLVTGSRTTGVPPEASM